MRLPEIVSLFFMMSGVFKEVSATDALVNLRFYCQHTAVSRHVMSHVLWLSFGHPGLLLLLSCLDWHIT
jgi:hypothetical protein